MSTQEILFILNSSFLQCFLIFFTVKILMLFYKFFQIRFPSEYFQPNEYDNLFFSFNIERYILFHVAPPIFIIICILGFISHSELAIYLTTPQITGLSIGIMYAIFTNGRALYRRIKGSSEVYNFFNKPNQILFHVTHMIIISIVGYIAGIISTNSLITKFIPTQEGLIDNFWAAFLGGSSIILFQHFLNRRTHETHELYNRIKMQLPENLIKKMKEASITYNASFELILSICIAESIQRPRWFRNLEKSFGFIYGAGTYGIMQVRSDKPLSDTESINLATKRYFENTSHNNWYELEPKIMRYNHNNGYLNIVRDIFNSIMLRD